MVEYIDDNRNQRSVGKSDKMVSNIIIEKSQDGYIFFEVKFEKGVVPAELSGKYSSIKQAKKSVEKYLNSKKETTAARRENFSKAREERKKQKDGSENNTKGSEHIRQGSDN
jgi:hypothetical protein